MGVDETAIAESFTDAIDLETGHYYGKGYEYRLTQVRNDPEAARRRFTLLRGNLARAQRLLTLARPKTERQRYRIRLWQWAHDVLLHFAEFGPQVLAEPGTHDVAQLRRYRKAAVTLSGRTEKLLRPLLTDRTIEGEQRTRFGVHLDYIDETIAAAKENS